MKKWRMIALSTAFLAAFAFAMPDYADAARLGGGRSFSGSTMTRPSTGGFGGYSGSTMNRQTMPAPMNRGGVGTGAATMGGGSMFGGMFGGLLAGSLIGSMLGGSAAGTAGGTAGASSAGFGFLDMLLLFGGVYVLLRVMRGRRQRQMYRDGGYGDTAGRNTYGGQAQQYGGAWDRLRSQPSGQSYGQAYGGVQARPADFDEQEFLQGAKAAYVRMQASWDRRDIDDIASFATEDAMRVFRRQAQEDPEPCTTEILMVNASVADVRDRGDIRQVSVVFDVLMREDQRAARPEQVREMWHFVCSRSDGDTWKLDGIDQLS